MALEQYIVRELRQDIKYLIRKVEDLEQKIAELHLKAIRAVLKPTQNAHTESEKMQEELEPLPWRPMLDK